MSKDEMLAYRDEFAKAKNKQGEVFGPWADNFDAMAHKTCVRQLAKWMPSSTDLDRGIAADETVRVDLSESALDYPQHVDGEVVDSKPAEDEAA